MVYFTGLLFDEDVTASLEGRCLDKVVVSGSGSTLVNLEIVVVRHGF